VMKQFFARQDGLALSHKTRLAMTLLGTPAHRPV